MIVALQYEEKTKQLAEKIAALCPQNERLVIFLQGELGCGKTTFTRFFLQALGYLGHVKSPTYTLVETYSLPKKQIIFHLDLYRLQSADELSDLGLRDDLDHAAIWLIEWPERAISFLPVADILCLFSLTHSHRQVEIRAQTPRSQYLLKNLESTLY